jgi:hypothetical protein
MFAWGKSQGSNPWGRDHIIFGLLLFNFYVLLCYRPLEVEQYGQTTYASSRNPQTDHLANPYPAMGSILAGSRPFAPFDMCVRTKFGLDDNITFTYKAANHGNRDLV